MTGDASHQADRRRRARRIRGAGPVSALVAGTVALIAAAFAGHGVFASFSKAVTGGPMSVSTASLAAASGLGASRSCASTTDLGTSLSWTASSSSATTGYKVLRSTSSTGPFSAVGSVSGINTTAYTDSITPPAAADGLYVAVKSANGMDVVSLANGTVTAKSGGPNLKNPTAIAVTPDGTTAYLANSGANSVTPVSLSTDTAGAQVNVGPKPPTGLAVTSDGTQLWVADGTGNVVTPVTVATNSAGSQVNIGFNADAIAITPDGSTAWIVGQTNAISLNLSTLALGTKLTLGGASFTAIAITPDGRTAYLTDASGAHKVWPLTLATGTWGTGIALSFAPQAIAITAGGTTAWVAGQTGIVPITLSSGALGTGVSVGGASFTGIAITPNGCWVYAADSSKNNQIIPVSTVTGAEGTPIGTDPAPTAIATAYPHATYYYEVEPTRNQWTGPPTAVSSLSFGQPPLSLAPAPPAFTSGSGTTLTSGSAGSFLVTTSGYPLPGLAESGTLPAGVSFTDNGDGTATISGTPTSTGSFPLTLTATNSQGSTTQSFSLYVYALSLAASGNSTGGTTLTSGGFTLSAGSTYLVLAMTHDHTAGTNTMSVGVGAAFSASPTFTQIGAQQDYDGNAAHYTAWYLSGGSGTGSVSVTVTNTIQDAYIEVVAIAGANATVPVVTATAGFSTAGTTAGNSATVNLSGAPAVGDYELAWENNVGDAGPGAPTSSSFNLLGSSYLHGGGGNGASIAVLAGPATQSASLSLGSNVVWATLALEIAHP